jgi:type I restriction enzyme S subunit
MRLKCLSVAGLEASSFRVLPPGTVLVAMIGQGKTRGQAVVLEIDAASNQNSAALAFVDDGIVPRYVWRWALSQYAASRQGGRGNAQPALNAGKVRAFWIPLPPTQEQRRIVTAVELLFEAIDRLVEALHKRATAAGRLATALAAPISAAQALP